MGTSYKPNNYRLTPILNVSDIQESFAWFEKLGRCSARHCWVGTVDETRPCESQRWDVPCLVASDPHQEEPK
jgi:hypothetical protein